MGRLRHVPLIVVLAASALTTGAAPASADTATLNWGQQNPTQSPPGRVYAAMDYDSHRDRVVLVGGGSGCCTSYADTWEWDGSRWSQVATSGPGGIGGAMAYDTQRRVSVFFNGGQTWEWNGTGWVQKFPANSPSARTWTAMAYDAARQVVVLFGGTGGGVEDGDTWTYDGTNWARMSPASSPSARYGTALAFDAAHNVVVLFGGRASGQRMNDTWTWNGSNWTRLAPATTPYPRFWHSMSYDAQSGETVMFGGDHTEPFSLGPENDTWLWDGTDWTRDWPSAAPIYRAGQTMAFDSAVGRTVLFGGTDELNPGTYYGDTWVLGPGIAAPPGTPKLLFNLPGVWFGAPAIGTTTAPTSILVSNIGSGPITASISTTGDFAVAATDCPASPFPLAATEYCHVQVTYSPTACRTSVGSLAFDDGGPGGPQSMVLQGGVSQPGCDADLGLIQQRNIPAVNATSPAGAVVNFQNPLTFDEEPTPPPIACDHASGSTFPIGTTIVTCSVTDDDDVTSTVSTTFPVTVKDTDLALTGVPADITTAATSGSGAVVNYTAPTAVDEDSPAPSVTCVPASGSLFPIGITTVTCTSSDADDTPSTVSATFRVSVGDGDLALVNMPADVTVQATSAGGAAVGYVMPTASDEDGTRPSVSCDHASGSLFPVGTTVVTCTATDPDDTPSTVSATFHVTVVDTDLGLAGVPQDVTVDATDPSGAVVTYVAPTGVDEDGGSDLAVTCDHASGATYPIGTTTVTCSVSDADDTPSTRTASFHITVNDTDLALTNVPADITAVATGVSGAAVSFTAPTAIDEDTNLPSVTCDPASGSTFAVGTTTVTCSATDLDDSPATVTATFNVSVIPDLRLASTVSPTTAGAHTTVTAMASVTNIGSAVEKVTITYNVAYVDPSGATSTVASDKAQVSVDPGKTATRTFSFAVKNTTAKGAYVITITARDVTGAVTEAGTFSVT